MLTDTEVSFKKTPQTVEWRTEKIFCFWYEQLVGKQRFEGLKLLLRHSDCECFLHKCFIERLLQAWLIFSSTGIKLLLPPNYCIPFDKIVIIYMMLCHVLDVHPIFFSNLLFKLYTEKQNQCGWCYYSICHLSYWQYHPNITSHFLVWQVGSSVFKRSARSQLTCFTALPGSRYPTFP